MAKIIISEFRVLLFKEGAVFNVDSLMHKTGAKHRSLLLEFIEICTTMPMVGRSGQSQPQSREDPLLCTSSTGGLFLEANSVIIKHSARRGGDIRRWRGSDEKGQRKSEKGKPSNIGE